MSILKFGILSDLFSGKSFLLGIGSQRAGSTLLHKLLSRATSNILMHPVKELHYFDSLFGIRHPQALMDFSAAQLVRVVKNLGLEAIEDEQALSKIMQCYVRANRILSTRKINAIEYQDLFRPCLQGRKWFGEITPEYMLMNDEQIQQAQEVIAADRIVVVLMVRHPARRYLSAFKLQQVYMRNSDEAVEHDQLALLEKFKLSLRSEDGWNQCQDRYNHFAETVERWQSHFGDDFLALSIDLLVGDTNSALQRISERTGFQFEQQEVQAVMKNKVNDVGVSFSLDDEAIDLCEKRFGAVAKQLHELMGCELTL